MDKIVVQGGQRLSGKVKVSGSKNAALPILAATILGTGSFELREIPELKDIETMSRLLQGFGMKVSLGRHKAKIQTHTIKNHIAPYELVKTMRASVLVLGPLLARLGRAKVSLPGGCAIGARPIDLHLKALEAMGAEIKIEHGYVDATCARLKGAQINFPFVTVTGTENIMMAAALAEGTTLIDNAAVEPEVVDLAQFLIQMGAKIEGAGTRTLKIEGVPSLSGAKYQVMPDRIEAGTFMIGAAMNQGDVIVEGVIAEHIQALIEKMKEAGVQIGPAKNGLRVIGPKKIKAVDIETAPYPGFATDFQAQFMAMMTLAEGSSHINETIFENRYMHVGEL
ncbi:MAG: UDP-N-acetylglucosamine 1-carboxyvinyltransferase, partial [Deltaproteobacteria bacterium]|nr:UDP-N-acetylglucosamine 1-carboxyvinyltransferase [Deltaproteobacteria bacterium]